MGIIYWQNQGQIALPLEQAVSGTQNQVTQPTPDAASVSTADWKTYQNKGYGFEVKYPNEYSVKESKEKNYWYVTAYLTNGYENIPELMNISIENITQKSDTFEKIIDLQKQGAVSNEREYGNGYKVDLKFDYVNIDGIRSLKVSWAWNKVPPGMAAVKDSTSYFLYHNDKLYSLAILGLERSERRSLSNQILSTFKFLN